MLGRDGKAGEQVHEQRDEPDSGTGTGTPPEQPVMPAPPSFPAFQSVPTLPQQTPGVGFESGRDSRAR